MALATIAKFGLSLLAGGAKNTPAQQTGYNHTQVGGSPTDSLQTMPALNPTVADGTQQAPMPEAFDYRPAETIGAATTPYTMPPNPAAPLPGNPNVMRPQVARKSQWEQAWEAQQQQRKVEYAVTQQDPLYGLFYGLGMGIQQRGSRQ